MLRGVPLSSNSVRSAAIAIQAKSVGVLRGFKGIAGVFFEFGGIASAEILNKINNNSTEIVHVIYLGITEFIDEKL